MQHPTIGHDDAKPPVTFREMRSLREKCPDYVVILPWNLREEVMAQLSYIREWDGQFVTAVPSLTIA